MARAGKGRTSASASAARSRTGRSTSLTSPRRRAPSPPRPPPLALPGLIAVAQNLRPATEADLRSIVCEQIAGLERGAEAATEQSDFCVGLLDPERRVTTWNAGCERVYERKASEMFGLRYPQLFPADQRATIEALFDEAEAAGSEEAIVTVPRGAGTFRARLRLRVTRDPAGAIQHFACYAHDLTEGRRTQATLQLTDVQARALLLATVDVVLILDRDGRYLAVVPTRADLLSALPPADLIGKTLAEVFAPEVAERFLGLVRRALDEQRTIPHEYPLDLGGRQVWFAAEISPLTDRTVLWVARDITERVGLDAAVQQAEKVEAVGRIAASVMHDLNNVLLGIFNALEILALRVGDDPVSKRVLDGAIRPPRPAAGSRGTSCP